MLHVPIAVAAIVHLLARQSVLVYLFAGDRASVSESSRFTRNHINKFGDCSPLTARSPGGSQQLERDSQRSVGGSQLFQQVSQRSVDVSRRFHIVSERSVGRSQLQFQRVCWQLCCGT